MNLSRLGIFTPVFLQSFTWFNDTKKKKKISIKRIGDFSSVKCFMWILYVNRNKASAGKINFTL